MRKQDGMRQRERLTRQQVWDSSRLQRMDGADLWLKGGYTGKMNDRSLFFNHGILH